MTSAVEPHATMFILEGDDALFQLQLRIARRADEVAREIAVSHAPELFAWIQAEREVFSAAEIGGT